MLSSALNAMKGYSWDKLAAKQAIREDDEQLVEKEHLLPVTSTYNPRGSAPVVAGKHTPATSINNSNINSMPDAAPLSSSSSSSTAVEVAGEVGAFVGGLGGVSIGSGGVKELWTHLSRPKGAAPSITSNSHGGGGHERKASEAMMAREIQMHEIRAETEVAVLDDMAASMARLAIMGKDINKELDVHTVMLSDLDMEMDTAVDGFAIAQKRLESLIKATDNAMGSKIIAFLLVVIVILIILIIL